MVPFAVSTNTLSLAFLSPRVLENMVRVIDVSERYIEPIQAAKVVMSRCMIVRQVVQAKIMSCR